MKKFLNLLFILPLVLLAVSCDDDDSKNLPQVSFSIDYEGAVSIDNTLYIVRGDVFTINAVTVTPDAGTRPAALGPVTYAWDYGVLGTTIVQPYKLSIDTSTERLGNHLLQLTASVIQEGKPLATVALSFPVVIVNSYDEIPGYTPESPESGTARTVGTFTD